MEDFAPFGTVKIFRSGGRGDESVSGAVGKEPSAITFLLSGDGVARDDRPDERRVLRIGFDGDDPFVEAEFGFAGAFDEKGVDFAEIFVPFGGFRSGPERERGDFPHGVAELRIGADVGAAAERDADLRTAAAAEDGFILQQNRFQSESRRGESGDGSGDAAAGDDQIEYFRFIGDFDSGLIPAEFFKFRAAVGRHVAGIGGEIERVAASVESGKIMQRNFVGSRFEHGAPGLLPRPLLLIGSENLRKFNAVDPQCESPRRGAAFPDGGPVAGSRPDVINARFGNFDFGFRVGNRHAGAVRHQVGGSHLMHRGRVDHPAAEFAERLRFEKKIVHGRLQTKINE